MKENCAIDFIDDENNKSEENNFDILFDLSYKIMKDNFADQFKSALKIDERLFSPVTFKAKSFQRFIDEFNRNHSDSLSTRSNLVRELYLLYQTSKAFYKYNDEELKLSYIQFRSHFYFPNIIYILVRYLPEVRQFLQKTIKNAYFTIQKKNSRLIYLFENAIYTDIDVIKTDILYNFLGNSMKKINPFEVKNINAFYKQVFLNHFFYYFKFEQKIHSRVVDDWSSDELINDQKSGITRDNIYREVLTSLQVENFREMSPTMKQLHYNYTIFKNVIINNEFQTMFLSSQKDENLMFNQLNNTQYKILSLYKKILSDEEFLLELKKLPLIYKLLKSVHLVTKNSKIKITSIRHEAIVSAIADELSIPFKNLLNSDISMRGVLLKIADNFVSSILTGEYISLQTLAPIKIDQLSFIVQLRKFIKLCISNNIQESTRGKLNFEKYIFNNN